MLLTDREVAVQLLLLEENSDRLIREFRKECSLNKTKKLSATIQKRNLPQMDHKPSSETSKAFVTVSPKVIAAAQCDIEIV